MKHASSFLDDIKDRILCYISDPQNIFKAIKDFP
jgi:hypothetical protein